MTVQMEVKREASRDDRKKDRVPVCYGNKLEFTCNDPAYIYRIVNDTPGRLDLFLRAGYEFTYEGDRAADKGAAETSQLDTRISVDAGGGLKAYRMRISKKFYNEDQEAKLKTIEANEVSMTNKNPNPAAGQYSGLTDD
jgi:hypothetical protein